MTRKLVHTAGAHIDSKGLPLDRSGAEAALETALRVFEWYGVETTGRGNLTPELVPCRVAGIDVAPSRVQD